VKISAARTTGLYGKTVRDFHALNRRLVDRFVPKRIPAGSRAAEVSFTLPFLL
jgi:hypothetical protein